MKKRRQYEEEAQKLARAIDLAIEAFEKECPPDFQAQHQAHLISTYGDWKRQCLNPEAAFRNLASLKYLVESVFTYFQEASGNTVEYFWRRIQEEELDFKREDKLAAILHRGRIRNRHEYELVIDRMPLNTEKEPSVSDLTNKLNQMLAQYEKKPRR